MKKGQVSADVVARKMIYLGLPVLFLIALILAFTFIFFGGFKVAAFDEVEGFDNLVLVNRLLSSKNCFTYIDEAGRVYPGILDFKKFNEDRLKNCVDYRGEKMIRLSLESLEGGVGKDIGIDKGSEFEPQFEKYVLIKIGERFFEGVLKIEIE